MADLRRFSEDWSTWDPMLLRDGVGWRMYVMAARNDKDRKRFWTADNHVHGFCSTDRVDWVDTGPTLMPVDGERLCAGNFARSGERYLFFGSSTVRQFSPNELDQRIFLAESGDGYRYERVPGFELDPDPRLYPTKAHAPDDGSMIFAWRDPYVFHDPVSGKYYLYLCAGGLRWGIPPTVAVAVSENIDGPYNLLPSAVSEQYVKASLDEAPVREMERVQVFYLDGRYHLVFSTWKHLTNHGWFRRKYGEAYSADNSNLYWMTSDSPEGPFSFPETAPMVARSASSRLYGVNLVFDGEGDTTASLAGWYWEDFLVETGLAARIHWNDKQPELIIPGCGALAGVRQHTATGYLVTEDWYSLQHRQGLAVAAQHAGYDVWVLTCCREKADRISEAALSVYPVEWDRRGLNPLQRFRVLRAIEQTYGELRPDIVHHHEGIFAELKLQTQMDYVPTRRQAGNQVFVLAAMLAHNFNREMQMLAGEQQSKTTERRAPLQQFTQRGMLRHKLIQRAERLTRPQGKLTLTMSANTAVKLELLHYLDVFKQAA